MASTSWGALGTAAIVGAFALSAEAVGPSDDRARQVALEREATEYVERVDEIGRAVQFHVGRLELMVNDASISRWSHYDHLESIKSLINRDLRTALERLTVIQKKLPDWKQESIDRMIAAARDLAADTSSAFFTKNARPMVPPVMNKDYAQLVSNLSSHAAALVTTADAAHAYALAHWKATAAGLPVAP
jgi:hypothetical protein